MARTLSNELDRTRTGSMRCPTCDYEVRFVNGRGVCPTCGEVFAETEGDYLRAMRMIRDAFFGQQRELFQPPSPIVMPCGIEFVTTRASISHRRQCPTCSGQLAIPGMEGA